MAGIRSVFSDIFCMCTSVKKRFPDAFAVGIIFILTLVWGRFFISTQLMSGLDMEIAFIKVAAFVQSWQDGFFIGRWSLDMNYGYGYPLLHFYSPLFFYCAGLMAVLTGNIVLGMNLLILLSAFLSVMVMYFFVKRWWGREAALFAAVVYLFAPYHSWDIYNRGTCAEFMAFLFLPLLLLSIDKIFEKPGPGIFIGTAMASAGLILCHNLMAMLIFPLAIVYAACLMVIQGEKRVLKMFLAAGALLYGVFLSAYFWMPLFAEMKFVFLEDRATEGWANFHLHFMTLRQALFAAWEHYQQPALQRMGYFLPPDPRTFQLGVLGVVFSVVLAASVWHLSRRNIKLAAITLFWMIISAAFLFLMTPSSQFIWEAVAALQKVQFPWRFFLILTFIYSFFAAGVIYLIPEKQRWYGCCILSAVYLFCYYPYATPSRLVDQENPKDLKAWVYAHHPMDRMEYLPRKVKVIAPVPPGALVRLIRGDAVVLGEAPLKPAAAYSFIMQGQKPSLVLLNHYYFPGWTVLVDGQKVDIEADNPLGVIVFSVPSGKHDIHIYFGHTPVRWAGEILSVLGVLGLWGGWIVAGYRYRGGFYGMCQRA
ncbi:MAG: 6-pyruvoyl-tetrahydropterin synthase-related protein [Candidatus Omnitrophota bacterium]